MIMLSMYMIILFLTLIMFFMFFLLAKKTYYNREKMSPFECGFDPISMNNMPFSNHFFMISLIFLIFDIEITLLIPMIYFFNNINLSMILTLMFFLLILMLGLYIEYSENSIDWKI